MRQYRVTAIVICSRSSGVAKGVGLSCKLEADPALSCTRRQVKAARASEGELTRSTERSEGSQQSKAPCARRGTNAPRRNLTSKKHGLALAAVRFAGPCHVTVHPQAMPLTPLLQLHVDQSIMILASVRSLPKRPLLLSIAMLAHCRAPVTSLRVSGTEATTVLRYVHGAAPENSDVSLEFGFASKTELKTRIHGHVCAVKLAKSHAPETGFCPRRAAQTHLVPSASPRQPIARLHEDQSRHATRINHAAAGARERTVQYLDQRVAASPPNREADIATQLPPRAS
jgi:hypothetical protein